ncbi:MAG: NAD(P)H-dependent oxidoreductase [Elusimicrobiota bacterium]|jgi:chromate reductase|nr:NAD(P)H-dependent oxidoreductase [Elusimicrobiota bacterium]
MKVLTLIGGISANSINKKLLELIKPLAPKDFEFEVFDIASLPFYSQDIDNSEAKAAKLKSAIRSSSAVLFITPEYNRSIPGVLKNAIDWASRPYNENVWSGKPAAVLGASMGAIGTFGAQMHLKRTIAFLGMKVMNQPEIYFNFGANVDDKGAMSETSQKHFKAFLDSFKQWIIKNS